MDWAFSPSWKSIDHGLHSGQVMLNIVNFFKSHQFPWWNGQMIVLPQVSLLSQDEMFILFWFGTSVWWHIKFLFASGTAYVHHTYITLTQIHHCI